MKKFLVILLAACASFGLTILSSMIVFSQISSDAAQRFAFRYVSSPLIAVIVGVLVGLVVRDRVRIVAALGLAPWTLWVVFATNWRVASVSHKVLTIVSATVYLSLGIGVAVFVGSRMAHSAARGSQSPSQGHA
jgi:hypothetical protein